MTATILLALSTALIAPGSYRDASGATTYIGTEHELPDKPFPQYLDAANGTTGAWPGSKNLKRVCQVREERQLVPSSGGILGASLFYTGKERRKTVILVHGSDAETREMGWIVPYFACNSVNVISYDQRGTGESSGNWRMNGPPERAQDAEAIYDVFRADAHVDARHIGVWAFSNGGWTAPIVALDRPLAFMILQSAPAESVERNLVYEVEQSMRHAGHSDADARQATVTWEGVIGALQGRTPVAKAKALYAQAKRAAWFSDSLLSFFPIETGFTEPARSGWLRFVIYDPASTLVKVRTPTLALYGEHDKKVDVKHDVPLLEAAFRKAGMRDLTVRWFRDAGHTLKVTTNGFDDADPVRYSRGYPEFMLEWLRAR